MENETKKSNVKVIALIAGLVCIMILCAVGAILLIGNKASLYIGPSGRLWNYGL